MSPLAGPLFAAAILLGVAGVLKLANPGPARVALRSAGLPASVLAVRTLALGEVAVAGYALGWGGRPGAAAVAVAYLGFAGFSRRVITVTRGQAPCGCFGASDTPLSNLHVGIDLAVAAVAASAVLDPAHGVVDVAAHTPLAGLPFVGFTILLAWLVGVALTAVPQLQAAARPPREVAR